MYCVWQVVKTPTIILNNPVDSVNNFMIFILGNEQDTRIREVKILRHLTSEHDEVNRLFVVYCSRPETEGSTASGVLANTTERLR